MIRNGCSIQCLRALVIISLYCIPLNSFAQDSDEYPRFAVKTNLLYDATTTLNVGVEFPIGTSYSMDFPFNYNKWGFSNKKKIYHFLVQPEFRYWFKSYYHSGWFIGPHIHYGQFDFEGIKVFGSKKDYRYKGDIYGVGFSGGYKWRAGKSWSFEATVGLGYSYVKYDRYNAEACGRFINDGHKNLWGPTKVGINLIYIIH